MHAIMHKSYSNGNFSNINVETKISDVYECLSFHSASGPETYQPQRVRLLSDVNVFGGLFLCWSLIFISIMTCVVRSVHYPLHNSTLSLSQQSWLCTLIQIRIVCSRGGGRYKDGTRNWRCCAVLLLNWRSRQRKVLSCWTFIQIKYIKMSKPVQICQVFHRVRIWQP